MSTPSRGLDPTERRRRELEVITEDGYASVTALAEHLGVTEMTVRRDIRTLAEAGLVRRVHGGASRPGDGRPFDERLDAHPTQKNAIARTAAGLLVPGSVVALDSGTTVAEVPGHLPDPFPGTVVTHSVPVMAALAHRTDLTVIGLGGQLHADTRSFFGPTTRAAIAELSIDTLLLATSGLTADGLHCATPHDAETKQALMARAARVVLLVDSGKIGLGAAVRVAPPTAVDTIVTDDGLSPDQADLLHRAAPGTPLILAES